MRQMSVALLACHPSLGNSPLLKQRQFLLGPSKLSLLQKEEMELWRVGVVLGRAAGKEGRGAGKDSWLSCSFLLQRPLGDTGALRWVISRSECWQGPSSRGTQAVEVSVLFLEMTLGVQERSASFLSAFRSGGGTGLS